MTSSTLDAQCCALQHQLRSAVNCFRVALNVISTLHYSIKFISLSANFPGPPMSSSDPKGSNQVKRDQVTLMSMQQSIHQSSYSTACNMFPHCRGAQHVRTTFLLLSIEEYHLKDMAVHSDRKSKCCTLSIWHAILSIVGPGYQPGCIILRVGNLAD
jgi:hypothetical protein